MWLIPNSSACAEACCFNLAVYACKLRQDSNRHGNGIRFYLIFIIHCIYIFFTYVSMDENINVHEIILPRKGNDEFH